MTWTCCSIIQCRKIYSAAFTVVEHADFDWRNVATVHQHKSNMQASYTHTIHQDVNNVMLPNICALHILTYKIFALSCIRVVL